MIDFYYNPGPNPMKVALFLEESGLPYRVIPVDMLNGEQHASQFTAINPNAKVPAIVDGDVKIFDSNAILLYLAEATGKFKPNDTPSVRGAMLSWMMFVATGLGPYSGQAVHFRHFAPEPKDYAVNRYMFEARRHYDVLDRHLARRDWMIGDAYTIIDMAVWGWARNIDRVLGVEARAECPHLMRLVSAIEERPAAIRAVALKEQYAFKQDFDDAARRHMFGHVTSTS